jgi:hypothetical protein
MDLDRLSTGEKIAGASAILLFIFMFFDWYTVDVSVTISGVTGTGSEGGSAWEAFSLIDLFLMLTAIVTVAAVAIRLTDAAVEPPVSMSAIVAVLGGLSVLLILYRMINTPDVGSLPGASVDVNLAIGIFLGLLAAAGITYGGYRAMQEEGTSFGDVGDRLSSSGHDPGVGGPTGGGPGAAPPPPPPPPGSETGGPPPQ